MRLLYLVLITALTGCVEKSDETTTGPKDFTPEGLYAYAMNELNSAQDSEERFYALTEASIRSFEVGKIDDAKDYAEELLKLAASFKPNWNYGNAIHKGNIVLGRIAVRNNDIEKAKIYLHNAGATLGSPQLDSFGPNMTLAKELLEKSEADSVVKYLRQCKNFWEMDDDKLEFWTHQISNGKSPKFGANLLY